MLKNNGLKVETGKFGAMMNVELNNHGPEFGVDFGEVKEVHGLVIGCPKKCWISQRVRKIRVQAASVAQTLAGEGHITVSECILDDRVTKMQARLAFPIAVSTQYLYVQFLDNYGGRFYSVSYMGFY